MFFTALYSAPLHLKGEQSSSGAYLPRNYTLNANRYTFGKGNYDIVFSVLIDVIIRLESVSSSSVIVHNSFVRMFTLLLLSSFYQPKKSTVISFSLTVDDCNSI